MRDREREEGWGGGANRPWHVALPRHIVHVGPGRGMRRGARRLHTQSRAAAFRTHWAPLHWRSGFELDAKRAFSHSAGTARAQRQLSR